MLPGVPQSRSDEGRARSTRRGGTFVAVGGTWPGGSCATEQGGPSRHTDIPAREEGSADAHLTLGPQSLGLFSKGKTHRPQRKGKVTSQASMLGLVPSATLPQAVSLPSSYRTLCASVFPSTRGSKITVPASKGNRDHSARHTPNTQ